MTDAFPFDATPCALGAFGVVRADLAGIAALRKAPGPSVGTKIPPSLLKHADHQTVLSLAAVLKAAADAGWSDRSFDGWAVIAAPRFLGRLVTAKAVERYEQSGVAGVSPLIVPTLTLHAVAGSLSLAIQSHGFNFGVSGGPDHVGEALLAGLAARDDGDVPGVWVVASGFTPEPIPDGRGDSLTPTTGYAVALALTAGADASRSRINLRVVASSTGGKRSQAAPPDANGGEPLTDLVALADFLDAVGLAGQSTSHRPRRVYCPLPGAAGAVAFDDDPARAAGTVRPAKVG